MCVLPRARFFIVSNRMQIYCTYDGDNGALLSGQSMTTGVTCPAAAAEAPSTGDLVNLSLFA